MAQDRLVQRRIALFSCLLSLTGVCGSFALGDTVTPENWKFRSPQASSDLGASTASGDVNGDGFIDLILGAPNQTIGESSEGAVFVFLGSASGFSAAPDWTAQSDQETAQLGHAVAACDVNDDGFADVIAGAPFHSNREAIEGRIFLWYGSAEGLGQPGNPTNADWQVESNQETGHLGYAVACAGDVNGDGIDDLIASARGFTTSPQGRDGLVLLWLGKRAGLGAGGGLETADWKVDGDSSNSQFGHAVASAGDVNGDGFDDILVGARDYQNGAGLPATGRAFIFLGSAALPSRVPDWFVTIGLECGHSVAGAGDVNGDGFDDVIVGAPGHNAGSGFEGKAELFLGGLRGPSLTASWSKVGTQTTLRLGEAVAGMGDVDGDGFPDIAVASPLSISGTSQGVGKVELYRGGAGGISAAPLWGGCGAIERGRFGLHLSPAGDVNQDRFADILVSDISNPQDAKSSVYLFHGAANFGSTIDLVSFAPAEASTLGKTPFTATGSGFTANTRLLIDGSFVATAFVDSTQLTGTIPAHDAGVVDVAVEDPTTGSDTLLRALTYAGPLDLVSVSPDRIPAGTRRAVTLTGVGFTPQTRVFVDAVEIPPADRVSIDARMIRILTPMLDVGAHDVRMSDLDSHGTEVSDTLRAALTAFAEIEIACASFSPAEASSLGKADFELRGTNFTRDSAVFIGGARALTTFVDATKLTGTLPAHAPGAVDVSVEDPFRGSCSLAGATTYVGPLRVTGISPSSVPENTPKTLTVTGLAFTKDTKVKIGAIQLGGPDTKVLDLRTIEISAPGLAEGMYDLEVIDTDASGAAVSHILVKSLTSGSFPGPIISSVEPARVTTLGGTRLSITGRNFTPTGTITFQSVSIDEPGSPSEPVKLEIHFVSASLLQATAPRHAAGAVDVVAQDAANGKEGRLNNAFEFVSPAGRSVQEIEATLVDGFTEAKWVNPTPFAAIHVYRDGEFLITLPGNATVLRDSKRVSGDSALYSIVSETPGGAQGIADFAVALPKCKPPVQGPVDRGPKDFRLRGTHPPLNAPGGGSVEFQPSVLQPGTNLFAIDPAAFSFGPNELLSGFSLFQPSTKLVFKLHGAKILAAPGHSLRLLVESKTPGVERAVEISLPNVIIEPEHDWMEVTYNTLKPPRHPDLAPEAPDPAPVPPFEPADYLVKVYAVGGGKGKTYFTVSSDASIDQILVPEVGCPLYPLLQVEDKSGVHSNPVIDAIEQVGEPVVISESDDPLDPTAPPYVLEVTLAATVHDTDIPGDPIVRYFWKLLDINSPDHKDYYSFPETKETTSNTVQIYFPTFGYYLVELEIEDNHCGISKGVFTVKVHPPLVCPASGQVNFTFPVPRPNALHLVPNLPGTMDKFEGESPVTFLVFVVDAGACPDGPRVTEKVEFGLFYLGQDAPITLTNGQPATVPAGLPCPCDSDDLDPEQDGVCLKQDSEACDTSGARFWAATFADMGLLPDPTAAVDGDGDGNYKIALKARGFGKYDAGPKKWSDWTFAYIYNQAGQPIFGTPMIRMHKALPFIATPNAYSTGSYDSGQYFFQVGMRGPGQSGSPAFKSDPKTLTIFGLDVEFPSTANEVQEARQSIAVRFEQGVWSLASHKTGLDAVTINSVLSGDTENLPPNVPAGGAENPKDLFLEELKYLYCSTDELFHEEFNTILFNAPIFAGFVGPVFVTLSATVSLGAAIMLGVQTEFHVAADPLTFDSDFFLVPEVDINLAAAIRADIFLGILSVEAGLNFLSEFKMPFHVGAGLSGLVGPEYGFLISLEISLFIEACIELLLVDVCVPFDVPILPKTVILQEGSPNALPQGSCPQAGSIAAPEAGGAEDVLLNAPDNQLAIASSPDGNTQVAVGIFESTGPVGQPIRELSYMIRTKVEQWTWPPKLVVFPAEPEYFGVKGDPKVAFLDNGTVAIVWTQGYSHLDPEVQVLDPSQPVSPAMSSKILSLTEIAYRVLPLAVDGVTGEPILDFVAGGPFNTIHKLTDDPAGTLRGDGRVSVAARPGLKTFWVSWVRYEGDDVVYVPQPPEIDPKTDKLKTAARMTLTGIAARKVDVLPNQFVHGPLASISAENNLDIDIEPSLAMGAGGSAMITWVKDATNADLLTSNVGRNLFFSKLTGNVWSAPAPVIADVSMLPGILEPGLILKDAQTGMVAFTACPANAPSTDVGFLNTRLVYTARYQNGAWKEPLLIYKKCDTPLFAHWPMPVFNLPDESNPDFEPDIVVNEIGALGTRGGGGAGLYIHFDSKTDSWGPPIQITPDDGRIHQGFAAVSTGGGEIVLLHQSPPGTRPGAKRRGKELPGGGGAGPGTMLGSGIMALEFAKVADPAITRCQISDPYAGPGAAVEAKVSVTNLGFAPTPAGAGGQSALSVNVYYQEEGKPRAQVAEASLEVLAPNEERSVTIDLVIPREPVRIIVEVDGVPGELSTANNLRDCPLGAQAPRDLSCRAVDRGEDGLRVLLNWTNGSPYDAVLVYRDSCLITQLPGTATSFVDAGQVVSSGSPSLLGQHTWEVRGKLRQSRSTRTICRLSVGPRAPAFMRGDANADGSQDLSDVIAILNYLFLGSRAPECLKSADLDDSSEVDITDGIFLLNHLFTGGRAPIAPYPGCGADRTEDALKCPSHAACP